MALLFLSALAVGFSGAMMPGPLLTYTIRQSLSAGSRSGFIISAGHAALEMMLIILIFMGFDIVLQSAAAQAGIGLIGGFLLGYMGFSMIYNSLKNRVFVQAGDGAGTSKNMFVSGLVISATNPYFLLWWAVVGLGFILQSFNSLGIIGVAIYYVGHISADFLWYGFISIVVGKTRKFIKEKPYRVVIAALGCLLVFFGGKFVFGAVSSFFK